jgi:hypothetical protein
MPFIYACEIHYKHCGIFVKNRCIEVELHETLKVIAHANYSIAPLDEETHFVMYLFYFLK